MVVAVLSVLMKFAVDMEYRKDNPAAALKPYKTGEYRPWTMLEFESFIVGAVRPLFIGVNLGLYTGQRISDCLKMRWDDFDDETIFVRQKKTGVELYIPCHPVLLKTLTRRKKRHEFIISRENGKQYSDSHFRKLFTDQREACGLPSDLHFHGLRKSATVALAEAGCTERQIMSITGHKSFGMVSHYTKKADQRKQARAAIAKLARS